MSSLFLKCFTPSLSTKTSPLTKLSKYERWDGVTTGNWEASNGLNAMLTFLWAVQNFTVGSDLFVLISKPGACQLSHEPNASCTVNWQSCPLLLPNIFCFEENLWPGFLIHGYSFSMLGELFFKSWDTPDLFWRWAFPNFSSNKCSSISMVLQVKISNKNGGIQNCSFCPKMISFSSLALTILRPDRTRSVLFSVGAWSKIWTRWCNWLQWLLNVQLHRFS